MRVVASLQTQNDRSIVAGVEVDSSSCQLRLAGESSTASEVARVLPVQVIDPSIHRILEEGSARRRRLIDWGVFHVKPHFLDSWRKYQRVLAQRNALIQNNAADSALHAWDPGLIASASAVQRDREEYVHLLTPYFESLASDLLELPVTVRYRQGWPADQSLAAALEMSRTRERRQRTTVVGPHRADAVIEVDGVIARKRVSRGQQKLLAAALILSQIQLRATIEPLPVCLLLDDPAAELDVDNLGKLLRVVERTPAQVIVTSLAETHFAQLPMRQSFHVEQGGFRQVI